MAAEGLIHQSQIPHTILRPTQFHDFVDFGLSKLLSLPIGVIPKKLLVQPIDVTSVAQELHRLAEIGSQQAIFKLGGPQVYDVDTLAKIWMRYRNVSKPILPIPIIGALMNSLASGFNTCPETAVGSKTWTEYLTERYSIAH